MPYLIPICFSFFISKFPGILTLWEMSVVGKISENNAETEIGFVLRYFYWRTLEGMIIELKENALQ